MEAVMLKQIDSKSTEKNIILTDSEKKIMHFICAGMTNKQISENIHLSPGTVRNKISVILGKLGLKNRAEIASYTITRNIHILND